MPRIVEVGSGSGKISFKAAINQLEADDLLLLSPGFYELPQGAMLSDVTIKGTGTSPEDTTIFGFMLSNPDSRYVTLENICINPQGDKNVYLVPDQADTYVTFRNCVLKGNNSATAAIAVNGKVTLELYSTRVYGGSVSLFKSSDFRLEMADSLIDYQADRYSALALEGHGTAIINNSQVKGSINTFPTSNVELNVNNTECNFMLLDGSTWCNTFHSRFTRDVDLCVSAQGESYVNLMNSFVQGGVHFTGKARSIMQNTTMHRLFLMEEARVSDTGSEIFGQLVAQDQANAKFIRTKFIGVSPEMYLLSVNDDATVFGRDITLETHFSKLHASGSCNWKMNFLATDSPEVALDVENDPQIQFFGVKLTKNYL
ncbi:MAG: hypothetical protein Q3960_04965 [Lactobacillus sp.]|nr:hypothetical protein [Lactobacillus sp.]